MCRCILTAWAPWYESKSSYLFINAPEVKAQAALDCVAYGGALASILSLEENDHVVSLIPA